MRSRLVIFFRKLKQKDWRSFLKHLFPYFIAVVSGVTTFFLYSYFNRDKVTIESVLVRQKEVSLTIDRVLASKLSSLLNGSFSDSENSVIELETIDKSYILNALKKLNIKSSGYNDKITELTLQKNKINESQKDSLSSDELNSMGVKYSNYSDFDFGSINHKKRTGKNEVLKDLNDEIESITKSKTDVDKVIKEIAQGTKKALEDNKDKFQIEVIAFNDGNQQTVIRQKGLLQFGATQLNLKKAATQRIEDSYSKLSKAMAGKSNLDGASSNYLIIEPKSFIVLNLEIDMVYNNKNRDIEVIKREYVSGLAQVVLTLYDIKNIPITPIKFVLQNDLEFDPNDELNKYIVNNLNAYLKD